MKNKLTAAIIGVALFAATILHAQTYASFTSVTNESVVSVPQTNMVITTTVAGGVVTYATNFQTVTVQQTNQVVTTTHTVPVGMVVALEAALNPNTTGIINGTKISFQGITFNLPEIVGKPITLNGQTLLVTTNDSGGYVTSTSGPAGTNTFTPPTTTGGVAQFVQQAVENNNPSNIGFYSTNGEWDLSVAGVFAQNSGQAAAQLSIEKYGIIPGWYNVSLGAAVLEGNQNGQNGTAAAYAFVDYRRPIGDVAFIMGIGGGYDNYTRKPMCIVKIEVEHRSGPNLAEFVGIGYDFEGFGSTSTAVGTTISNPSGLILGGGIRYAFGKLF